MSFCKDCITGVRHEGTPEGKFEEIGGVRCYVATPSAEYPKDKVLLFLTDIFGIDLVNSQLLIDDFARNGFKTIALDYLNGDSVHADALNPGTNFDLPAWIAKHGFEVTRPPLDKVTTALKAQGVSAFGATGYCFGGLWAVNLARENVTKAIALSHPSLLQIPADFEALLATSRSPILINSCEVDRQFPPEKQKVVDELLGNGKYAPGYERTYWEGCVHGFAVRGDMSDPKVKAGKEGAFKATVDFMAKHL